MRIVNCRAYLHMMVKSSLIGQERKNIRNREDNLEIQTANGIVRSTKEAKVFIQELGTYFYAKLVEDYPSVLSLGRLCDELGYSYS